MRRKDREMPVEFGLMVIDKCEWAVISFVDKDNKPYCIPVSIVRKNNSIYFHCAKEGYKIECLKSCNEVCISCVGNTCRLPNEFTTEYESAIVRGNATEVTNEQEAIEGLKWLSLRHTPTNMSNFDEAISKSLFRTAVYRVDISSVTAKRKKYGQDGKELKFGKMDS